jgi:hypothetical protein
MIHNFCIQIVSCQLLFYHTLLEAACSLAGGSSQPFRTASMKYLINLKIQIAITTVYLKQYCHSSAHLHAGKGIANGKTLPTALYTEITLITEEPEKKSHPFSIQDGFSVVF